MSTYSNVPGGSVVIRAEARKSLSFNIWIRDPNGRPLDITGCSLRLVLKKPRTPVGDDDTDNLITSEVANPLAPLSGYAQFALQASEFQFPVGEYPFSITLLDATGYSSVVAKGIFDLVQNTEVESVDSSYSTNDLPSSTLQITLRGRNVLAINTGTTLPPGTTSFTLADQAKLEGIEEGAQRHIGADWLAVGWENGEVANKPLLGSAAYVDVEALGIPSGGAPGEVLVKTSSQNFDTTWAQQRGTGGSGVDAAGVSADWVPTANGVDGWGWKPIDSGVISVNGAQGNVNLTLGDIDVSGDLVHYTEAEQQKLQDLKLRPEWGDLDNVPAFGSAAYKAESDFLAPLGVGGEDITSGTIHPLYLPQPSQLRGFSSGTANPTGGVDGDLYFQFTS